MRVRLACEEAKQKLQAEIEDLKIQIQEIDDYIAANDTPSTPRGTTPTVPRSKQYTNGHCKKAPAVHEKFDSGKYTEAGINLPSVFSMDDLAAVTSLGRKERHAVRMCWLRKKWIVGAGHAKYRKTDIFGGITDYRKRKQSDPRTLRDPDPLKQVPRPLDLTPEQKASVVTANVDAARAALEKRLQSKQRQLDDCVPDSPSEQILQSEIEEIEEQLAALEPRS